MKDIGVNFSSNLKYDNHLNYVINKAKKKLGCINRSTHDFKGPIGRPKRLSEPNVRGSNWVSIKSPRSL